MLSDSVILAIGIVLVIILIFIFAKFPILTVAGLSVAGIVLYFAGKIQNPIIGGAIDNPYIVEKQVFSQNGEDGVLASIFSIIGTTNKYYVEFGVENGEVCNTRYLREVEQWHGLMMDTDYENLDINLHTEHITLENIRLLFEKYKVPQEFDLLSIDIDGNDYVIWRELCGSKNLVNYRPRVVVIEYNSGLAIPTDAHVTYEPTFKWKLGSQYFGASIIALNRLGKTLGYTLVYSDKIGVNLFFIRTDILTNHTDKFPYSGDAIQLYNAPNYGFGNTKGWTGAIPEGKQWTTSDFNLFDTFNTVVIYGNHNCPIMQKIFKKFMYYTSNPADNNRVEYFQKTRFSFLYPDRKRLNLKHHINRIAIIVNSPELINPLFSAFAFLLNSNSEGEMILSRCMFDSSTVIEEAPFSIDNLADLIYFPTSMGTPSRVAEHIEYINESNLYEVGEKYYSGKISEKNYETDYTMRVAKTDITIQNALKKHALFDKEVTAAGSPYGRQPELPGRAVAYDVGGNIGCVGIPLSRATDVVIAFEPFERTFVLYEENIRLNKTINMLVIFATVGNSVSKEVYLSKFVDNPKNIKTESGSIVRPDKKRIEINPETPTEFGGIRLGIGGQPIQMLTLDIVTQKLRDTYYVSLMRLTSKGPNR